MGLDIFPLGKESSIKKLLRVRSSHVRALSPLGLDRIPSFLRCSSCHNSKTSDVYAIEGDMSPCQLIMKNPLVKIRGKVTFPLIYPSSPFDPNN